MRSKTVRLTVIRNGLKRTLSVSGGLVLLQMVLELDTGRWPPRGWIVRSTLVGERMKHSL